MLGASGLPRAHSLSRHALLTHTHSCTLTRGPLHSEDFSEHGPLHTHIVHTLRYMHTQQNATVDQTNKLAKQPMRHTPKNGHPQEWEGDGRELELGRGRGHLSNFGYK